MAKCATLIMLLTSVQLLLLSTAAAAPPAQLSSERLVGLGTSLKIDDDPRGIRILEVFANSGAAAAGLTNSDMITAIDGQPAAGMSPKEALGLLGGSEGTAVTLKLRSKRGRTRTVTVTRGRYLVPSAEHSMLADKVGYLRIRSINEETVSHVRRSLNDFWVEGAEGIVLDLRKNKGGRYREVIKLVDLFVDADEALWLEERLDNGKVKRIKSSTQPLTDLPVVVLIDNVTRSGGELIACALKRNQRAKLVGQTTLGDGFVKNRVERPDGKKDTVKVARLLCRRGAPIAERGVEPQVQMPADATPQEVLDRAIEVLKAEVP